MGLSDQVARERVLKAHLRVIQAPDLQGAFFLMVSAEEANPIALAI